MNTIHLTAAQALVKCPTASYPDTNDRFGERGLNP